MSTTAVSELEFMEIERYPDGYIPAGDRYVEYEGQVIIRTRHATYQRWTTEGAHVHDLCAPSMLRPGDCRERDTERQNGPMNPDLDTNQCTVYYTKTGETYAYEVTEP